MNDIFPELSEISPREQNDLALLCHACAINLFPTMLNPFYRGKKFTWDKFPEMLANVCEDQAIIESFEFDDKKKEQYRNHARKTGRQIGERMIKIMKENPNAKKNY
jgi:hypothetical protein